MRRTNLNQRGQNEAHFSPSTIQACTISRSDGEGLEGGSTVTCKFCRHASQGRVHKTGLVLLRRGV